MQNIRTELPPTSNSSCNNSNNSSSIEKLYRGLIISLITTTLIVITLSIQITLTLIKISPWRIYLTALIKNSNRSNSIFFFFRFFFPGDCIGYGRKSDTPGSVRAGFYFYIKQLEFFFSLKCGSSLPQIVDRKIHLVLGGSFFFSSLKKSYSPFIFLSPLLSLFLS